MKHYHVAQYINGKLVDECAVCGKSFRDTDVHIYLDYHETTHGLDTETCRRMNQEQDRLSDMDIA